MDYQKFQDVDLRRDIVNQNKLCYNCLGKQKDATKSARTNTTQVFVNQNLYHNNSQVYRPCDWKQPFSTHQLKIQSLLMCFTEECHGELWFHEHS